MNAWNHFSSYFLPFSAPFFRLSCPDILKASTHTRILRVFLCYVSFMAYPVSIGKGGGGYHLSLCAQRDRYLSGMRRGYSSSRVCSLSMRDELGSGRNGETGIIGRGSVARSSSTSGGREVASILQSSRRSSITPNELLLSFGIARKLCVKSCAAFSFTVSLFWLFIPSSGLIL